MEAVKVAQFNSVVLKYFGSVDPLTILYTLEDPLPLPPNAYT
jgi:hypothetical protein